MSQFSQPKVFVIILNWNGWRDTVECLESIQGLDYPDFRIVLVDNGSEDDSLERIGTWAEGEEPVGSPYVSYRRDNKPVRIVLYNRNEAEAGGTEAGEAALSGVPSGEALVLIRSEENLGFSGGCNLGLRYARAHEAEYFWLLNNDTVVDPGALTAMVSLARSDGRVGIAGSMLRYYHDPRIVQAYGGGTINWWTATTPQSAGPGPVDHIVGASMLIRRRTFEEVGYLDDAYFFYLEETDYCRRAVERGWKLAVAGESRILHKEGGAISGGGRVRSLCSDLYALRSTILFFRRHGGVRWPLALTIRLAGILANRLRRGQADRVLPLLRVVATTCREIACGETTKRDRLANRRTGAQKIEGPGLLRIAGSRWRDRDTE